MPNPINNGEERKLQEGREKLAKLENEIKARKAEVARTMAEQTAEMTRILALMDQQRRERHRP